jgi:hypothetical protein
MVPSGDRTPATVRAAVVAAPLAQSPDGHRGFVRDGYAVVRGAFDPATARDCRTEIWAALSEHPGPDG